MRPRVGVVVGGWTLIDRLGGTANSEVWKAERGGEVAALKMLLRVRGHGGTRYQRFRSEVAFLRTMAPPRGVLPLVDAHLPDRPTDADPPWLATPVAREISAALGPEPPVRTVVEAVRDVAGTLAVLAEQGVGHRDIKPANLFERNGEWLIGDFGLVTYPSKEAVTRPNAKLGPAHFVADEMVREPDVADPHPADVFSLAKTLWVLCVPGQQYPPSGQQRIDVPPATMAHWVSAPQIEQLDLLIERATDHDPQRRPSMRDFASELKAWLAPPAPPEHAGMDALAARVRALSARGIRARAADERRWKLFDEAWAEARSHVETISGQLAGVFPEVRFADPRVPTAFGELGGANPRHRPHTYAAVATNADADAVELVVGFAAQWINDDRAAHAAWIRIEDPYAGPRTLWSNTTQTPLGSARESRAISGFAQELASRLGDAVAFAVARMELRSDADRYASWTGAESDVGALSGPWSAFSALAYNDEGCYVVDTGNNRIVRFGPGGRPLEWVSAGAPGLGYDNLQFPAGGCFTHDRHIWIADHDNRRLRYFDEHGRPLEGLGLEPPGSPVLQGPADVGSGPDGTIYVADRLRNHIIKFGTSRQVAGEWGGDGREPGEFRLPCGIAVRHGAFVYVSDSGNHRVQKFTRDGELVSVWGSMGTAEGRFNTPHGIALDAEENVYVADSENHRIQQFTSEGELMRVWGTAGTAPGQFMQPRGVSVDGVGNVYVAEFGQGRVQRFAPGYLEAL